jgi:hypothetical protein
MMMRKSLVLLVALVVVFFGTSIAATEALSYSSDLTPTIVQSGDDTILHKNLDGDPIPGRYSPTGTDILHTGESATWTFDLAALGLEVTDYAAAVSVVLSLTLDDHPSSLSLYTGKIKINGATALDGVIPAPHGAPYGGQFNNYASLSFEGDFLESVITVEMTDLSLGLHPTGGYGNWFAVRHMDVTLSPNPIPEPNTALLLGFGLLGLGALGRRQQ